MKKNSKEIIKLKNGIQVVNIARPDLAYSICSIWVGAGSKNDPKGKEGMAHLLEHLLGAETKKFSDKIVRYKELESKGIYSNASINREYAYFYNISPNKYAYNSLEHLVDGIKNPILKKEKIESEKSIIRDEAMRVKNNESEYIYHLNMKTLFPSQDFSRDLFQEKNSLSAISSKNISDFYSNYYRPDNSFIFLFGNYSTAKIKKYFEKEYLFKDRGKHKTLIEKNKKETKPKQLNISKNKSNQITVSINFETTGITNYKELIALDLLKEIFADNWSSLLIEKLRIKNNLTYWVEGDSWNTKERGYLSFIYTVDKKNLQNSLNISLGEINKFKKKTDFDIRPYKNIFESSFVRNLSNPLDTFELYGESVMFGDFDFSPDQYVKALKGINKNYVNKLANKYLTKENLAISLIGDIKESDVKITF